MNNIIMEDWMIEAEATSNKVVIESLDIEAKEEKIIIEYAEE